MKKLWLILGIALSLISAQALEITDADGKRVIIEKQPQRIVIGGGMWPLASVIIMLEGSSERIIYMPQASKNALQSSFLIDLHPHATQIASGNTENIEELLRLEPDLFICHNTNEKLCNAMRQTPVPTIAMSTRDRDYNSKETLKGWIEVLAPILSKPERVEKILAYTTEAEERLKPREPKPTAIIIHRLEKSNAIGIGGLFANYLLEKSGAKNAIEGSQIKHLSFEELYAIDPDIIYLNNFNTLTPQDLYDSKSYAPLKAVQNKRVYKFPFGSYRPFAPSADLPLILWWLHKHHYGIAEIDVKKMADEYYKDVFSINLSEAQLERIFIPNKKAGALK